MTQPTTSDDDEFIFNFEYIDTPPSVDTHGVPGQNTFHDVSTSFQPVPAFRSQSFGQQRPAPSGEQLLVPPGARRRRAQSDNPPFPFVAGLRAADHDTSALADDYSPSSDLPPITSPYPEHTSSRGNDFAQSLSPLMPSPDLLSPRPGSDASSVRSSVSPSPSHPRFVDPAPPLSRPRGCL
ncbi:hypothetical protein MVEN_02135500 [Mycena venus]|uniref:Uncharacterized protein n=1 Tax=Mycena venus TaxID=2733690 RepID=A0A8H6X993_9AGAR|nr:hypothetical protein MVEN_02135500 [Mycena venus]